MQSRFPGCAASSASHPKMRGVNGAFRAQSLHGALYWSAAEINNTNISGTQVHVRVWGSALGSLSVFDTGRVPSLCYEPRIGDLFPRFIPRELQGGEKWADTFPTMENNEAEHK
jgi:hypothetical protein